MLRASSAFIAIAMLVGCTNTPISPTEQTIIAESPNEDVSAEEPTTLPPEPTTMPAPTQEPKIGELLWSFRPGSANESPFWVSPLTSATVVNGIVYVGASDVAGGKRGSLHALDATDGSLLWSYDHNGHTPSTPTITDDVVYFGSEDHNIYAVDALDGNLLWSYTTEGHVRSIPAVHEAMVFVNSQDGYLYALDATSGDLHWQYQFDEPVPDFDSFGTIRSSPVVSDGAVLIVGDDHILRAINKSDGTLRWEYEIGSQVFGSPRAIDGIVYVGSLNRNLYAFDTNDGNLLWSFRAGGGISSTPAVEHGRVYIGSNVVTAIDSSSGTVLWEFAPGIIGTLGSPAVENQKLYTASFNGQLFALDKDHGSLLAVYDLAEDIGQKAPAVLDGVMYVVAKDRTLYAVKMMDLTNE